MELDRWFWRDQDHVGVKKVWDALCAYCYLPRLRDQVVLIETIQEGLGTGDYFAYATSVADGGRYEGLRLGSPAAAIYIDAASVRVKPEVARAKLEAERRPAEAPAPGPGSEPPAPAGGGEPSAEPPRPRLPGRFYATAIIDPDRAGRDMGQIAEEVLQHLTTLASARVRVTVEVEAEVPEGVPEDVQRVVTENCQVLKFTSHGFEGR